MSMLRNQIAAPFALAAFLLAAGPQTALAQGVSSIGITQPNVDHRRISPDQVREVAPTLEQYTQQHLYGEVWSRPGLSSRDRSLVSMAALITRGESQALGYYANQAIENGVKPSEISEEITHLAFYAGWGRAFAAIGPVRTVFAARNVITADLPPAFGPLQAFDAAKDASRADGVSQFKDVAPGVVEYTDNLVFRELWQRPYLSQRDRSLITIAALIADGKGDQLVYHLNRGMDQGLTEVEVGELLTQLAFYAGWPSVFAALPVVKKVFAQRAAVTNESP